MLRTLLIAFLFFYQHTNAQFVIHNPGVATTSIEDIEIGGSNRILVATDKGIVTYNGSVWNVFDKGDGLSSDHVKALEPLNTNLFLYSTTDKQAGSCDYNTVSEYTIGSSSSFNYISAVHRTGTDTLYGTNNGLVIYRGAGKTSTENFGTTLGEIVEINWLSAIQSYVVASTDKIALWDPLYPPAFIVSTASTPIPSNRVLCNIVKGAVSYDGTDKGLYMADFTNFPNMSTKQVNRANTPLLPSDTITAVAVSAADDNLYLGTPKGLAVRVNNKWYVANTNNSNLPSNDISELAINGDELWIGTKQGHICSIKGAALQTLGISADKKNVHITCYPNPATTTIYVDLPEGVNNIAYTIFDQLGRQTQSGITSGNIETSSLSSGSYYLRLQDDDAVYSEVITIK